MNDQTWNDPGARASASRVDTKSERDWVNNTLQQVFAARAISDALVQFDPNDRLDVLEDAHQFFCAGMPRVLLGTIMEQATFWADRANRDERKAYCLATFNRMSDKERASFLAYVQTGRAHE